MTYFTIPIIICIYEHRSCNLFLIQKGIEFMYKLFSELEKYKIITILRGFSIEEIIHTTNALYEGGIRFIEVTFDQKNSDSYTSQAISYLRRNFPSIHIGAGTVITENQLKTAYSSGAEFIISPNINPEIIKKTKSYGLLSIPGALTPSEIITAYDAGADIVKLFPSDTLGLPYLQAIMAPINHIPLAAVGGISLNNISDFIQSGVTCVGIGSNIANSDAIHSGQYHIIKELAQAYVDKISAISNIKRGIPNELSLL